MGKGGRARKTEEVQGRDRAKEEPPISGPREEVWPGSRQMELAGGPWSPAVTVTEPCVSSPWSDWPWSLRIWGLEGGQLAGKPGHGVLEGSVGLRRASGKGGAAVRERKRWGVMGARQAPSPGEAEEEGEGGGQSEGWPHSRGCLGPERTGVKVGPHGRVRLC